MVRPRKARKVYFDPDVTYFKPRAVPMSNLSEVELSVDELEAVRMNDVEKLSQIESAEKMGVHQSTFQRTLAKARQKIADALVNGKAIKIRGGHYDLHESIEIDDKCVCPECGTEIKHERGKPCNKIKCEKCGSFMVRT